MAIAALKNETYSVVGKLSTLMSWKPSWSNLFTVDIDPNNTGIAGLLVKSIDFGGYSLEWEYNQAMRKHALKLAKYDTEATMTIRETDVYDVKKYFYDWFSLFWNNGIYQAGDSGPLKKKRDIEIYTPKGGVYVAFAKLNGCVMTKQPTPKFSWDSSAPIEYTISLKVDSQTWETLA